MIEPNTRLASDQARIQINTVQPCVHADGTPYVMAQFYAEPGACPDRCPRGCEPVEVVERDGETVKEATWGTPDGAQWPRCTTCGADMNPAVDSPARTPDVVKDALYVPSEIGTDELAKLILVKADARRAEAARVAVDHSDGLVLLDPTHAAQVVGRDRAQLADGAAVEAVTVQILSAGFAGSTPASIPLTVLVPTDKPLADAVKKAAAKALKEGAS